MLLTQFRWITGCVSGGCLEGDIAKKGWWRTQGGEPVVVTYDSSLPENADDDDIRSAFGLGCDGVVEVMLERAGAPGRIDPLEFASACTQAQRRGALVTVIHSRVPTIKLGTRVAVQVDGDPIADDIADDVLRTAMIADGRAALASGESCHRTYSSARGSVDVFVEAILPPPRLFVFGTGHDAVPVVQAAKQLGWDVAVCAEQVRVTTRQRFSGADEVLVGSPAELAARVDECDRAVAIVMAHSYATDRANLGMLLATNARYIGVLGPRTRTTRMLDELGASAHADSRLHAPIGLEIGAETPQEIALAILSEVQSVLRRVPARSLRDLAGPIHERPMPRIAQEIDAVTMPSARELEPHAPASREMPAVVPLVS